MKVIGIIRTTVCFVLILSLLSVYGCSGNSKMNQVNKPDESKQPVSDSSSEESPDGLAVGSLLSDKPVTFTMLYADESVAPYRDDWPTIVEMTRRTNVTLDMQVVPGSDYGTKLQMVLNSGDLPDIISAPGNITELALNGKLLPFSEYFDKLPNFMAGVSKYNWDTVLEDYKLIDGKVYQMPVNAYTEKFQNTGFFIRQDILEENNIEMPTSFDELYLVLKELKNLYPDVYPWVNKYGTGTLLACVAPSFDARYDGPTGFIYDQNSKTWVFGPGTDNFKEMLQYINKLYSEGLIDIEYSTLPDTAMQQKIVTGQGFFFFDWITFCIAAYTPDGVANNPSFKITPVPPLAGPRGTKLVAPGTRARDSFVSPVTIKDNPNFEVFLKFIDWMYTEGEGMDLFSWGIEGQTYEIKDGKKAYLPVITTARNPEGTKQLARDFGAFNNCLTFVYPMESFLATMDDVSANHMATLNEMNAIPDRQPAIKLTNDELEQVKIVSSTLSDYYNQMIDKFIMGKESFANWDAYVQECKAKGAESLSEIYNKAWERQNGGN